MTLFQEKFAVVIPTFKRVHLLKNLLTDLLGQTILPAELIVVDGDPASEEVKTALQQLQFIPGITINYISSLHGNAPFQRYLGVCQLRESEFVVFVDDDIKFFDSMFFEKLLMPFMWGERYIVGVSPIIDFPNRNVPTPKKHTNFRGKSIWKTKPGEITPLGDRIEPQNFGEDYTPVHWLRGGVMAYRLSELKPAIYNEDVFSLSYIRCGLGVDDTFLSREVGTKGELLLAFCAHAIHPDVDESKAYPVDAFRLAYARAYSRRFINDHFRVGRHPLLKDRAVLVISLLGNAFLSWIKALKKTTRLNFQYALGYTIGALRAFFQKPTAKALAPGINWRNDAKKSLSQSVILQKVVES